MDIRHEPSQVRTTYEPKTPTVTKEGSYRIIRGKTKVDKLKVQFDPKTKNMHFSGDLEFSTLKESTPHSVELDLAGSLQSTGFVVLKPQKSVSNTQADDYKIGAKATCLSAAGTCSSAFIDIYVYHAGVIYHHQVEFEDKSQGQAPVVPETREESYEDFEGGADIVEGAPGPYVGNLIEDIQDILEIDEADDSEEGQDQNPPKQSPPKDSAPNKEKAPKISNSKSQAIGSVNEGRLENAIDMLALQKEKDPAGFKMIRPERKSYFATSEMAHLISVMGDFTKKQMPGHSMTIGDISYKNGGKIGSHKSHQTGLDVDVAFYFNNKTFLGYFASGVLIDKPHGSWMVQEQWALYKELVRTQLVDRIFIHRVLKKSLCEQAIKSGEFSKDQTSGLVYETLRRLIADGEHFTHFHLRAKCSKAQTRCRQMAEPVNTSGCF